MSTRSIHRKIINTLLALLSFVSLAYPQNLVPNPGFEDHTKCPRNLTGIEKMLSLPWEHPHNITVMGFYGSPDLYDVCATGQQVMVPKNMWGYQYPHSGQAYAGIINQAEYLQAPLSEPLIAGETYYLGFYISLADKWCAAEHIGAYLSHDSIPPGDNTIFDYEPQVEADMGFLTDSASWFLIHGCFVASGGEDHFVIGNFRSANESGIITPCPGFKGSYYYVDDVFLYNMSTLDIGDDRSLCPGDSLILQGGFGNTSYVWQDQSTADTFLVQTPGIYYVETTNICGTVSDTVDISPETDPPQIDLPDIVSLCEGEQILLDPQVMGVAYAWGDGSDSPQLLIDTAGEYSLTVTNGCGSDTHLVTITDAGAFPSVILGTTISICPGEILEIEPISTDAVEWLWHDGSTSSTFFVSAPGPIHVTVTNACGSASDTADVILTNEPPLLDLGEDITKCEGDVFILSAGVAGVSYLWQDGSTAPLQVVTASDTFILQISNSCGSTSDTVEVVLISPPPFPFLGNDTTLCVGDVHTLAWTGPDGITLQWESGSNFPFNFIDLTGQYYITVSNQCGINSDSINLTFISPPDSFDLGNDTMLCIGQPLLLSVPTGIGVVTWQDGSHLNEIPASVTQTYIATVTNQCGTYQDDIYVEIDSRILVSPTDQQLEMCPDETLLIDVTQAFLAQYLWNQGSTFPSIEVNSIGQYTVEVSTECGLEIFVFDIIESDTCSFLPTVYIPNVFSPNGDDINDHLDISTDMLNEIFYVQFLVYDRWGSEVFKTNNLGISWDGTFNNKIVNQGVYVYVLNITNKITGISTSKRGDITVFY